MLHDRPGFLTLPVFAAHLFIKRFQLSFVDILRKDGQHDTALTLGIGCAGIIQRGLVEVLAAHLRAILHGRRKLFGGNGRRVRVAVHTDKGGCLLGERGALVFHVAHFKQAAIEIVEEQGFALIEIVFARFQGVIDRAVSGFSPVAHGAAIFLRQARIISHRPGDGGACNVPLRRRACL